jgi:hypothetical protein
MVKEWTIRVTLVAILAVGVAACDDDTPTTPNNPRDPVTETFTGEVTQSGVKIHTFSTAGSGTVTVTLKQVAPDSALVVGLSLGNWGGSSCQVVFDNAAATQGFAMPPATMSGIGDLCVRVYDVGNIGTTPASYTVEVVHP